MMKALKYTIYTLLCVLFFCSCEQNINITLPYNGDKIVVSAILTNDSLVYAHITKSASTEKDVTSFEELQGCNAELYENDILKETLKENILLGKRYYISTLKIKNNTKYKIKVSHSGLNSVEGADLIPSKPFFVPIDYWKLTTTTDTLRPYKLTLKIKDSPGMKNYYRMRIFSASYNTTTKRYTINKNNDLSFGIDNFVDQGGIFGSFDDHLSRTSYFTDETFDGQEITLTISLRVMTNERIYIAPEVAQLSRDAYLYFDSKRKQVSSEDNPFAEAVVVYNNIKNGYGIVGGVADSVAVIKRIN